MAVKTYYGLPEEVKFCSRCVMSNQRPVSEIEFKHTIKTKKRTLNLNEENVCDACLNAEKKENINWKKREEELYELLDKYRSKDGSYDCIVPGSGGKDSAYQAHILKYKYKMNPLTITWPPILYTEYGYENWKNWINSGFDNLTFTPNGKIMKLLTKLSIENLFHPFQTFMLGQKNLAPKIAANYGIPLIFYGENEAEYGNPIADNNTSLRDKSYFSYENIDKLSLGGVSIQYLKEKYDLTEKELEIFLPINSTELSKKEINVHYLGYYLKWIPQEAYYYAVENTAFKARPFRTQGTYSKYNSIDDKIDDFHYYTTFIKFGIGRATYDVSQEIRNNHLNIEEGKKLIKKYDGELPSRYFKEVLNYIGLKPKEFHKLTDTFRSPHLWKKTFAGWKLRHTVNRDGFND